jgi:crotonobetaine/carnitine-CoA ligase
LEDRFGFPFVEFYGMAEVGVCAADSIPPRRIDTTSVGRPLAGTEFKLVDADDNEVPVGEPGQLCVRRSGPDPRKGLCRGYLDNPEATNQVWRNGWFYTGDILRRDEDGRYYFVDRIKHMIRRSGQNMAAAEIEAVLQGHPAVFEVAVVPVPDEIRQEEPLACVVLASGFEGNMETAASIFELASKELAYFKAPGWIVFMDSLPGWSLVPKDENPASIPGIIDMRKLKVRT